MKLTLHLRHDSAAAAAASGWYLPDASTERLLEELCRCGLACVDTRIHAVPLSDRDRTIQGFLIVPNAGRKPVCPPRALPCREVAGRLYVPIDARIEPPMRDEEVRALCDAPVAFLHPVFGISEFDESSTLGVGDLIHLPETSRELWNAARHGSESRPKLHSIVLIRPPTIQDIFGGAENEIGNDPTSDLPPMAKEPSETLMGKATRSMQRLMMKGVLGAAGLFPKNALRRTWVNDMADWAGKHLQNLSQQLDILRNKQLHRLLNLLQTDPEEGLRHAISMNDLPHRGLAPPSASLGSRTPDFNADRLGGRKADFWNISTDWQEVLRRKYRELADRERRLGRFRRAAYIYAELLGDFFAAANVLKQGRHFREAALLYEKHLNNPVEAARCLAEGGLLQEAIETYLKIGRWLEVADLYERLGDRDSMRVYIERVVEKRLENDDPLGAANLIQERLQDNDKALAVLTGAWPASRQAIACLTAAFHLLGMLGRHEVARERLRQLRTERGSAAMAFPLASGLATISQSYPDLAFRHQAMDLCRILTAEQLSRKNLEIEKAVQWVDLLTKLALDDRLLRRDGNRHISERRSLAKLTVPAPTPVEASLKPIRQIELPRQIEWMQLRSEWHSFFAVGVTKNHLTLVRGVWDGPFQSISWECPRQAVRKGLLFQTTADTGHQVALAVAGRPHLIEKTFPATDALFNQTCVAGTPAFCPVLDLPYAFTEQAAWSMNVAAGCAILSRHSKKGALLATIDLTRDLLDNTTSTESSRVVMAATTQTVAIALGNRLVLFGKGDEATRIELPRMATGLLTTLPHTRSGIVVLLEHGAVMCWSGTTDLIEIDRDLPSPEAAFPPGGPLVLLSPAQKMLVLLDVDSRGVRKVTRHSLHSQTPIAVAGTSSVGKFAILEQTGCLSVYPIAK